jgi:hypothetical protein
LDPHRRYRARLQHNSLPVIGPTDMGCCVTSRCRLAVSPTETLCQGVKPWSVAYGRELDPQQRSSVHQFPISTVSQVVVDLQYQFRFQSRLEFVHCHLLRTPAPDQATPPYSSAIHSFVVGTVFGLIGWLESVCCQNSGNRKFGNTTPSPIIFLVDFVLKGGGV